jgi:hypothetical protein
VHNSEKFYTVDPKDYEGHHYSRPSKLSPAQFLSFVRGLPVHVLRRKMSGRAGIEFQRLVDEAAQTVAQVDTNESNPKFFSSDPTKRCEQYEIWITVLLNRLGEEPESYLL